MRQNSVRRLPRKRAAVIVLTLSGLFAWQVAAGPPAVHASDTGVRAVAAASAAQLNTALAQAQPGDRIMLGDGVLPGGTIRVNRAGTASAPITIAALNPGKTEVRQGTTIDLAGSSHVTIEGLYFNETSLELPPSAFAVRVTRSTFTGGAANSVTISSDDSEVDHNRFQNKTTQSVYLQITGPGAGIAQRTRVHHNYFLNHTYGGENGGESIRIGFSHKQHQQAFTVVENNLFERANGDPEAISVKSSDNTIRNNTIRDSRGEITLRHGWRTRVEGNFILGGVSGIRFYGNDHVIVNNVIQNNTGRSINVGGGDIRDDTTSTTSHEAADRCLVAFNTLVGNQGGLIAVGPAYALAPDRITIANNIEVGTGTLTAITKGTNLTWQGNVVFRGTPGMPAGSYRVVDPRLAAGTGGLNRLSTGSPAIDTSAGSYPQVTLDMDGVARTGTKDVGADEFSATGTQRRPLLPADVGPSAP